MTGEIIGAVLNCPGSWHDANIARPIFKKLFQSTPDGYWIIADTAFPRGTQRIHGRIKAPLKDNYRRPADAAEWGMRTFRSSFGRLRVPLEINNNNGRADLLEICVRLNNVRAARVQINEIRQTYLPTWRSADDREYFEFENMMFGDIRRSDRVARFHRINIPS